MIDFRKLLVWEKSHLFVIAIYQATGKFPRTEVFGLTNQMRRAAVSIPSNLAEGCGRATQAELAHFAQVAMGSASELEYQLILAHELDYIDETQFQTLTAYLIELRRMLNKFILKVRSNRDHERSNI